MLMDNNQPGNTILDEAPVAPSTPGAPSAAPEATQPGQIIKKKSKAGLVICIIAIVLVLAAGVATLLFVMNNTKRENWHKDLAQSLVKKVAETKSEKLVYFKADLAGLNGDVNASPYGDYADESYATFFDGNAYICIDNGTDKVSGTDGHLELSSVSESGKCKYEMKDEEKAPYLYNYITQKYGYIVDEQKTQIKKESYFVTTDKGSIKATISQVGNTIKVMDDRDYLTKDYSDPDNIKDLIMYYKTDYSGTEDTNIYDVKVYRKQNDSERDVIMISTTYDLTEAAYFLRDLSEFFKGKPVTNALIGIARYGGDIDNPQTDFLLRLNVSNGDYKIDIVKESANAYDK